MKPPMMVVPFTPQTAFTLEESSLLKSCNTTETFLFEYVLAMWGLIDDLIDQREDQLYEQLAADLGDLIVGLVDMETAESCWFSRQYDQLYALIIRLYQRFKPYLGRVPDGLPGLPVTYMTYHPFVSDASVLRFHVD